MGLVKCPTAWHLTTKKHPKGKTQMKILVKSGNLQMLLGLIHNPNVPEALVLTMLLEFQTTR